MQAPCHLPPQPARPRAARRGPIAHLSGIAGIAAAVARGALVGAGGGAAVGVVEAGWTARQAPADSSLALLGWATAAYALAGALVGPLLTGAGHAAAGVLQRALGRRSAILTGPGFALGGTLGLAVLWVGRVRYYWDVAPHGRAIGGPLVITLGSLGLGLGLTVAVLWAERRWGATALLVGCGTLTAVAGLAVALRMPGAEGNPPAESAPHPPAPGGAAGGPNVFLVVADTLGARYLRAYDPEAAAHTPALDALAEDGVVVSDHCAQSSWTKPSFASIVTGLPPRTHTALDRDAELPDAATTLAEVFAAHGYETLGYSNVNPNNSSHANFDQGFEEFVDVAPSDAWLGAPWSATSLVLYRRGIEPLARRFVGVDVHHFYQPADAYTDLVLERLRARKDRRPLFALLHYMDPHSPYMGGRVRGRPMSGNPRRRSADDPSPETMTQGYVADIEFMDAHLRRLMAGLRELGWYDAALIAFTSDHGEEIYEHGAWGHGDSLYDEVLRVPLILKLPRAAAAGSEVPALTRQVDLAPTLLELAGIPVPSSMVGVPILARDGSPGATGPGLCLSSLRSRGNDMDAIRSRDVSLIRALETRQERIAPLELYDLRQDPGQQRNLAGRDDPRQRPLESALERLVERSERRGLESLEMDPASTVDSRLRALGYLK